MNTPKSNVDTAQNGSLQASCPLWADIITHKRRFDDFVDHYQQGPHRPMIDLKRRHSSCVLANGERLVLAEGLNGEIGRAALLGALYHDVGRFPQVVRWGTFNDAASTNHGALGVRVLKRENMLEGETACVRGIVLSSVALHNRYILPPRLPKAVLTVTCLVRDADKLDIMRIMAEHVNTVNPGDEVVLRVRNEPDKWSPHIAEMVLKGMVPSYKDLVYINDFRMLLGTWLEDLYFPAARAQMAVSGHLEAVLSGLPDAPALRDARERLFSLLEREKQASHHARPSS